MHAEPPISLTALRTKRSENLLFTALTTSELPCSSASVKGEAVIPWSVHKVI